VIVKDGCIDKMVEFIDSKKNIGMIGPKIFYPDGTIQRSCKSFTSIFNCFLKAICLQNVLSNTKIFNGTNMNNFNYHTISKVDVLIGAFWLLRREAVVQIGLLDDRYFFYYEDEDWCKRFWEKKWDVIFFPDAEIIHYTGKSSNVAPVKYYIQQFKAGLQYCNKYHSPIEYKLFIALYYLHQIVRIVFRALFYLIVPSKREINLYKLKRSIACLRWLLNR
jgi:hypothetical protein